MSRGYIFENPAQTDGVPGDLSTPTRWDASFEAARLANYNAVAAKMDADVTYLMSLLANNSSDTLSYAWTSNDTITVAPGMAIASDGTQHTVANATILSLDSDLDTGTRAADKIYFVWIGKDSITDETKMKLSLLYATPPTSLVSASAYRLKNFFNTNAGSNIEQFCEALPETWPIGETILWTSPYKPAGTFWAQGQLLSRTHGASARIFAKLGTTWGVGDGSTTFALPDTRGRSPMGSGTGSGLTARTLGTTLGEEGHANTGNENGPHTHTIGIQVIGDSGSVRPVPWEMPTATVETDSSGLGTPHNTIHPVFVSGYIIKG